MSPGHAGRSCRDVALFPRVFVPFSSRDSTPFRLPGNDCRGPNGRNSKPGRSLSDVESRALTRLDRNPRGFEAVAQSWRCAGRRPFDRRQGRHHSVVETPRTFQNPSRTIPNACVLSVGIAPGLAGRFDRPASGEEVNGLASKGGKPSKPIEPPSAAPSPARELGCRHFRFFPVVQTDIGQTSIGEASQWPLLPMVFRTRFEAWPERHRPCHW